MNKENLNLPWRHGEGLDNAIFGESGKIVAATTDRRQRDFFIKLANTHNEREELIMELSDRLETTLKHMPNSFGGSTFRSESLRYIQKAKDLIESTQ